MVTMAPLPRYSASFNERKSLCALSHLIIWWILRSYVINFLIPSSVLCSNTFSHIHLYLCKPSFFPNFQEPPKLELLQEPLLRYSILNHGSILHINKFFLTQLHIRLSSLTSHCQWTFFLPSSSPCSFFRE